MNIQIRASKKHTARVVEEQHSAGFMVRKTVGCKGMSVGNAMVKVYVGFMACVMEPNKRLIASNAMVHPSVGFIVMEPNVKYIASNVVGNFCAAAVRSGL